MRPIFAIGIFAGLVAVSVAAQTPSNWSATPAPSPTPTASASPTPAPSPSPTATAAPQADMIQHNDSSYTSVGLSPHNKGTMTPLPDGP
ncbi:MAG: hypothetical protein B7Y31_03290 [Novosphingobium sp. 16-62-11]|nr:MAG: hypothetical protein B7Y31_03290 [Novosphingobium sp. 16-62-11]